MAKDLSVVKEAGETSAERRKYNLLQENLEDWVCETCGASGAAMLSFPDLDLNQCVGCWSARKEDSVCETCGASGATMLSFPDLDLNQCVGCWLARKEVSK